MKVKLSREKRAFIDFFKTIELCTTYELIRATPAKGIKKKAKKEAMENILKQLEELEGKKEAR